ncbi:hypothetical protein MFLAVUS_010024 [Mucor flavus]|uniref:Transcription initiation factor IIF subunit beta n=1 Tax=Mucor flavus TaxID=439312 RepID=A0ABP9ZBJ5_9FUNG
MDQLQVATQTFISGYKKDTPSSLKLIDVYLVYILITGIIQFVYMVLAGTFPYNAFLGGFISTVGSFVLASNLRIQTNSENRDEFKTISPERAFADFAVFDALFEDDPGSLEEVFDEDDAEDLKLDDVDTKVWLVKVPSFLANKWKDIDEDNLNLGSVRIYNRPPPGRTSAISLVLPEEPGSSVPREYNISILPGEVQNKFVFSEDQNGVKSISGTVHHECAATPTEFRSYRDIMRKRVLDAGTPQRSVQVLGQNNQPVFVPGASSSMPNSSFSDFVTTKKRKIDKEKATRMPRNELMDLLFAAFDKFPYWSFKGIVEHTNQPNQYLKEVLAEICILNKRGPYAGNYQLKPEYKQRLSAAERQNVVNKLPEDGSSSEDDEEDMEEVRF